MPDVSSIIVADATPTNHTFYPMEKTMARSLFRNREAVTAFGQMELILGLSLANAKRLTNRVNVSLNHPFEITVDGNVIVRDIARYSGQYILPSTMLAADRARFSAMVKNTSAHAVILALLNDLDPPN